MRRVAVCVLAALLTCSFTFVQLPHASHESLLPEIEKARKKLEGESVQLIKGQVGTRRVRVSRRKYKDVPVIGIVAREMAIAVGEPDGKIRIARAIKRDPGFEVLSSGFTLYMRRENG